MPDELRLERHGNDPPELGELDADEKKRDSRRMNPSSRLPGNGSDPR